MRDFLLNMEIPGRAVVEVTLTIPGKVTLEQWDLLKRRYFKRLERSGFALVWRVELQRRKQPHLHLAAWLPATLERGKAISKLASWIECLPEENQDVKGAKLHAIQFGQIHENPEDCPGWYSYLAGHASKRKKEQLGWQGKQWGILGRSQFQERKPVAVVKLRKERELQLRRTVRRFLHSKAKDRWRRKGMTYPKPKRSLFGKGSISQLGNCAAWRRLVEWLTIEESRERQPALGGREYRTASGQAVGEASVAAGREGPQMSPEVLRRPSSETPLGDLKVC